MYIIVLLALAIGGRAAVAGTLVINANTSDPAPRAAWAAAIAGFQREHPGIDVKLNVYDHESYKMALRNWLTSASPDVIFWFAGNRMRQFVTPGLLADVSDVFTDAKKAAISEGALGLVSVAGRQYGVPYSYYHWGLYFRRDLLESAGVTAPPATFAELLDACARLKRAGIEPLAIGSKDLWPLAGWFDYLDMRINGLAFHMDLMDGKVAYTDQRVRAVFAKWRELIDGGCFVSNHASISWQESQALIGQGRAAVMLMGNFIVPNLPPELKAKMEFVRFPAVVAGVLAAEDAPMNTIHIPARAANKEDAKLFLAYVLRADVQESLNRVLQQIPVNTAAAVADDRFLRAGQELLRHADGLAQFFDRDTNEELALVAMKGFQEFMIKPDSLDDVLATIERARARIYKP